jgi:hypothetical protein
MRLSCEVIRDLLPLYAENIAGKDTRMIVEEHLESCPDCTRELEHMKKQLANVLPADTYAKPLKKLRNALFKKKLQTIIFTAILTLTIAAVVIANLTTPDYIPYSRDVATVKEKSDGTVLVEFQEDVSGYNLNRYEAEDRSGYEYYITTWSNYWNRNIIKSTIQNTVLNPNGEKVSAVYYYHTDGSDSVLIYGKDRYSDGGVLLLPRLVLGYYLLIALIMFALSALLLILLYRNEKARYWLLRIAAIPACYAIGHFCVKGFYSPTCNTVRDLIAIITIAFLLYIAFLMAVTLFKYYKQKAGRA